MDFEKLFEQFLKERIYLKNVTEKTKSWYEQCWKAYKKFGSFPMDKTAINGFVVNMRAAGMTPVSCNVYIIGINAFLMWLHLNEHHEKRLKIQKLKVEQKIIKAFSEAQLKAIINYKPKDYYEMRLHAMMCLMIDTGARLSEVRSIERVNVDFHNMLIKMMGKGQKERIIPFSVELRKILYRFSKAAEKYPSIYFFPVRDGGRVEAHNFWRDMKDLCDRLKIEGVRASAHTLRHTFALNYVRQGGNLFALQKMLGHTTLAMTRRYTELQTEDLQIAHVKVSLLNHLKR
jgi:integrase/recombinase XerD